MNRYLVFVLVCAVFIAGCGKKKARARVPVPGTRSARGAPAPPPGTSERGLASWYGHPYHGRPAADGEIYDMETLVAAHRTLPFQTRVRVRNLSNDKTVDVRIIDRGPFVAGRIIDLSHAAAKEIDLIGPGVGQVEVTILGAPANPEPALFAVQVGAFREKANADRAQQNMLAAYGTAKAVLRPGDPPVWRILAGQETSEDAAEELAKRVRTEQKEPQAFVVRLDP
ncbi:MAG TPA: septal ring lytic transglycosylase RlpA family protein [Bryobacteraceae bacterium]|jgi:rare lipoprotein A|nr:septal ring lytic transglycosylase RlpA family protein [Bryobacteraceae bacterium]